MVIKDEDKRKSYLNLIFVKYERIEQDKMIKSCIVYCQLPQNDIVGLINSRYQTSFYLL